MIEIIYKIVFKIIPRNLYLNWNEFALKNDCLYVFSIFMC